MKSSYLNKYDRQSNDIGTKMSAIHKFIFNFNTYLGPKFNIFNVICRKLQFLAAILDFVPQKKMLNTYNLAYIRFGFSTSKLTRNSKKTLYIMKNKVLWPLAWTILATATGRRNDEMKRLVVWQIHYSFRNVQVILLASTQNTE